MGSQAKQAALWGRRPQDWALIQEPTGNAGYQYALNVLKLNPKIKLLDIGCGSGLFCRMAYRYGAEVTGLDATAALLEEARLRLPEAMFLPGEMEELPFAGDSFDVVTGFNSFQYAESTARALAEARRVLKPNGTLMAMIWGNPEDCEAASFLKAAGSLMPPPPPGAAGPFALTEHHLLESLLADAGFAVMESTDIPALWEYNSKEDALKGLLSSGPVSNAVAFSGPERVAQVVGDSIDPYVQPDSRVIYQNKFRMVTAVKAG